MALWHAAALFVGAAAADHLTRRAAAKPPPARQPWFWTGAIKPAQVVSDDVLVFGERKLA